MYCKGCEADSRGTLLTVKAIEDFSAMICDDCQNALMNDLLDNEIYQELQLRRSELQVALRSQDVSTCTGLTLRIMQVRRELFDYIKELFKMKLVFQSETEGLG